MDSTRPRPSPTALVDGGHGNALVDGPGIPGGRESLALNLQHSNTRPSKEDFGRDLALAEDSPAAGAHLRCRDEELDGRSGTTAEAFLREPAPPSISTALNNVGRHVDRGRGQARSTCSSVGRPWAGCSAWRRRFDVATDRVAVVALVDMRMRQGGAAPRQG